MKTKQELTKEFESFKKMYNEHKRFFEISREGMDGKFLEPFLHMRSDVFLLVRPEILIETKKKWKKYAAKLSSSLLYDEGPEFDEVAIKFLHFISFINAVEEYQQSIK